MHAISMVIFSILFSQILIHFHKFCNTIYFRKPFNWKTICLHYSTVVCLVCSLCSISLFSSSLFLQYFEKSVTSCLCSCSVITKVLYFFQFMHNLIHSLISQNIILIIIKQAPIKRHIFMFYCKMLAFHIPNYDVLIRVLKSILKQSAYIFSAGIAVGKYISHN